MTIDFATLAPEGIRGLQPYQPGKPVEELQRELGLTDVVKLASNENPLGASPTVREAVAAATEFERYPDGSAWVLKEQLSEHLRVPQDQLTIGNGSNDVLELLGRVFLRPGTEAIVSEHAFVVYPLVTIAVGATLTPIPARDFGQDLDATLAAIGESTRCVFIANPNNPTGTWLAESALRPFLDAVPPDVIVVLDEAYCEYVQEDGYPDGVALTRDYPNLVVTRTFSKAYGLAALRVGYSISNPVIADLMNRIRQPFNVNALALAAASAALSDQDHVRRSVAVNAEGLAYLARECERLGLGYIPSVGNFLTIDMGQDAAPLYEALLRKGVIVRPIGGYGLPNHLRVTVGLADENERLIAALETVLGAGAGHADSQG